MSFRLSLSQEKSTKCLMECGSVLLNFFWSNKRLSLVPSLFVLFARSFEQVPVSGNQELFGLFKSSSLKANISFSQHEVSWKKFNRVVRENLIFDCKVHHGVINLPVGLIDLAVNDKSLGLVNHLVDLPFLKRSTL